jgi:regulatory protein spx
MINIISQPLTKEDIFRMLKNTENGFEDIISERSKPFQENNLDMDNMKTSELVDFIIKNPTVLKRPIIVSNDIVEIGYNADDIRAFIPPHMRTFNDMISCGDCDTNKCVYHNDSAVLAKEIKEAFEAEEK